MWKYIYISFMMAQGSSIQAALPGSDSLERVVVSVGTLHVQADEFTWKMQALRSACYSYFTGRYGVYNGADFWEHAFGCDTPVVWLRQQALKEIVAEKQQLLLMQSYGVLPHYSFPGFLAQWQQENVRRQQRVQQGGIVYGNTAFDVYSYYAYLYANAWLETHRLVLQRHSVDTGTLKAHYNAVKATLFAKPPAITVELAVAGKEDTARRLIRFEPDGRKVDELQWGEVFAQSMLLQKAGVQSAWFCNEAGARCRVTCREWQPHGYLPFEEVLENTKTAYAGMLLEKELQVYEKQLPVKVNLAALHGCRL